MPYRNTEPYLQWGGKIDPLSEIRNMGIITTGNVVIVKHPSDTDYRTVKEAVGREVFFDTPQTAIDSPKIRNGKNDFVIVCPRDNQAPWVVAGPPAGITLDKDNVHLVVLGAGRSFGSNSVILEQPGTAGTIGTMGILRVTGNGCEVAGFYVLGTAGTSVGGTMGDGGDGGLVTVGAGVQGLDFHDFKIEKTGIQWDAGTTGITGTPAGDIVIGSAARDITIRDGFINSGTGLLASASHGIKLMFNNINIRVSNVEFMANHDAAASTFILNSPGTVDNALSLIVDRSKFYNTGGTATASAVGGTMGVGMRAIINESPGVNCTQIGTAGSTFVTPVYGTATVVKNPYLGIGTAALVSA